MRIVGTADSLLKSLFSVTRCFWHATLAEDMLGVACMVLRATDCSSTQTVVLGSEIAVRESGEGQLGVRVKVVSRDTWRKAVRVGHPRSDVVRSGAFLHAFRTFEAGRMFSLVRQRQHHRSGTLFPWYEISSFRGVSRHGCGWP